MGATWVATPNTRQHDAYYQRQYVEGLTRSGTSPNTLEQCQTDWQWFGRVGATLGRGWAMVGPPYWPHWILVGKIQCGSPAFRQQITGVISRLRGPGPEVLTRPGTLCRERTASSPRAEHCAGSGTCIHSPTSLNPRPIPSFQWPPLRVEKVAPNRRNKGGGHRRRQLCGTDGGGAGTHEIVDHSVVMPPPMAGGRGCAHNQLRVS